MRFTQITNYFNINHFFHIILFEDDIEYPLDKGV